MYVDKRRKKEYSIIVMCFEGADDFPFRAKYEKGETL